MSIEDTKIAILGAGSWGLTLAAMLAGDNRNVVLWSHNPSKARQLQQERRLTKPIEVDLPLNIEITSDIKQALAGVDVVLFCCQSQAMRDVAKQVQSVLSGQSKTPVLGANLKPFKAQSNINGPILVSGAKGLELGSLKRMSEVIAEILPAHPVAALSGPNLAVEILQGLPTASVIGCSSDNCAAYLQQLLSTPSFRVYTTGDIIGVELGGTLKNIIAIAAGGVDGLNLGTNAKSAMLTRGLAEMSRFAVLQGAKPTTLAGLSGMGDLFATCSSRLSRNYRLGFAVAQGVDLDTALNQIGAIAEGVPTASAVCELSKRLGTELPIAGEVERTLAGKTTPKGAIMTLMSRPLVSE